MSLGQEIPVFPWTRLATNIFNFEGDSYLLLVDYTSRYPIICKMISMTAQHVIGHLKVIFSEYGLARHHCVRQWSMLHSWSFYQDHARIQGKPYHQFTPLSPVKWACREVCANSKKLVLQGQQRRCRPI